MVARAEADGIAYQLEVLTLGTTDAAAMQIARAGVPSGCISIPCRYVHTNSETVDSNDVEACIRAADRACWQTPSRCKALICAPDYDRSGSQFACRSG